MAYHQSLASALSTEAGLLVSGLGSLLMPMANAVRTAKPIYMYDAIWYQGHKLLHDLEIHTVRMKLILAHLGLLYVNWMFKSGASSVQTMTK
jgi:hypothetical protein